MKRPRSSVFATTGGGSRLEMIALRSLQEVAWALAPPAPRPYGVVQSVAAVPEASTAALASETGVDDDPRRGRMRLEAVLVLAKTPLSPRKLSQLAHLADATEARTLVRQLNRTYDTLGRAMRVEQVAGGYRLLTRPSLAPWLARLGHLPPPVRLSTPMMETLAVVAYRQPVSRANTEAVRGVACGELLRQLMERDLIRIVGRGEELGRPYLYGTTKRFLQLFGLPSADALPPIEWQALQEDPIAEESPLEELSTSTKEPVVSIAVAPDLSKAEPEVLGIVAALSPTLEATAQTQISPAVAEDEEWDDEDEDDQDEDDADEDWDDEEDDDWDDDELDEDEEDDDDDELDDDGWEEVDDEEADDEPDDDDEDWDEDEDEEDWDDAEDDEEVDDEEVDDEEVDDEEVDDEEVDDEEVDDEEVDDEEVDDEEVDDEADLDEGADADADEEEEEDEEDWD